jgi:hypothetical protein
VGVAAIVVFAGKIGSLRTHLRISLAVWFAQNNAELKVELAIPRRRI